MGAAILAGFAALWQSLRTSFGGGPRSLSGGDSGLPERQGLLAEKNTLLRAIKDIAFERELGKISEEDFVRLDRAYRVRAKRVLSLLDRFNRGCRGPVETAPNLVDRLSETVVPRIAVGQDDDVGEAVDDPSDGRSLAPVAVAVGAEDTE